MNIRFLAFTAASCTIVFAMIFALTAPVAPIAPALPVAEPVMYADCDAVRAAGAAPLRASQPGYRPALDGNMNGVACEPVGTAASTPAPIAAGVAPPAIDTRQEEPQVTPDYAAPPPPSVSAQEANPMPPGATPAELPPLT